MRQYFPEPYEPFKGDINAKVDLSNYATKTDLKNISHINVSSYALKSNLASLKTEVDKLDIDKLTSVPIDLAKLSNVVKNDVVKKTEYDKLVNKANGIDTTNFVSRTKYEKDGSDFEDKINKIEKKIPDISGLATTSALTAVENKIPNVTSLVKKKTDFDCKITEVEGKIPNINGLATNSVLTTVENKILDVTNLVKQTDFDVKLKALSDRVTRNKSKDLLLENGLKKIKTFDTDYFEGKKYFEGGDGTENMLVFQVKNEYFGRNSLGNTQYYTWKSKGISDENFYYNGGNIPTKLTRPTHVSFVLDQSLFQDASKTIASSVVNVYICYKLLPETINTDNALKNCLFGAIEAARPNNTKDPDNFI